jgi:hypothetical protein
LATRAGSSKSPKPCWREGASGFRYVDHDLTPDGVQQLVLRAGPDGKAEIALKGRGADLHMPALPISHLPVQAQIANTAGACWSATYGTTLRDDAAIFKAKSQ